MATKKATPAPPKADAPKTDRRKKIDWEIIEPDWRAGVLSKEQLAKKYDVSRPAMEKHFGKLGIARDLKGKIRARTTAILNQEALGQTDAPVSAEPKTATEQDIVDANATVQSAVVLGHRKDIQRSRKLCLSMLAELEIQSNHLPLMEQLVHKLIDDSPEGKDARAAIVAKVISLGSRVATLGSLATTLRSLVSLERQAFGLDDPDQNEANTSVDEAVRRVEERMNAD